MHKNLCNTFSKILFTHLKSLNMLASSQIPHSFRLPYLTHTSLLTIPLPLSSHLPIHPSPIHPALPIITLLALHLRNHNPQLLHTSFLAYCSHTHPMHFSSDAQDNKKSYAKKMAQAHLRSVGMGEFTPKRDSYQSDTSSNKTTKWKRKDSDEFDFET